MNQILLSKVNKLEKRIGPGIWDGVMFNRDGIANPVLTILHNKAGNEIRAVLRLEEIENCSHAPCVCGEVRQFMIRTKMKLSKTVIRPDYT